MDLLQHGYQRAGLAALLVSILRSEEELTHDEIKNGICNAYAKLLGDGHYIGDLIDARLLEASAAHCKEQAALKEAKDILGS
jgi:hypothetical protein